MRWTWRSYAVSDFWHRVRVSAMSASSESWSLVSRVCLPSCHASKLSVMQAPSNLSDSSDTTQPSSPAALDATLAVRYLNSQLAVNHDNAQFRCKAYEGKHTSEEQRLSYAWAKYVSRQKGDAQVLEFTFEAPQIFFVCDHDAILELKISAVHALSPDKKDQIEELNDFRLSFRITTEKRTILGNDVKVGDHESRIHLLVFDFDHARLLVSEDDEKVRDFNLDRQLASYLKALQVGGHHVLFFPPEFDENDIRSPVRFSLSQNLRDERPPVLENIYGYTVEMINGYLSLLWYTCAFIARQRGTGALWDDMTSLAGYQTWRFPNYAAQWHSSFRFTPPRVTILCAKEVVLHFTLSEVRFYPAKPDLFFPDFVEKETADYTGWEIALIIDISATKTDLRIKPDNARFTSEYSKHSNFTEVDHERAYNLLVDFFVERYFKLVAATRLQYLFHRIREEYSLIRSPTIDNDGSWWTLEQDYRSSISALAATIKHTKMEGFDIVVAISQSSINSQFLRLFRSDEFSRWVRAEKFRVEVKTMSVQLLDSQRSQGGSVAEDDYSDDDDGDDEQTVGDEDFEPKARPPSRHAIVTVHVLEGTLGWLLDENNLDISPCTPYAFGECQLAFEVALLEREVAQESSQAKHCPRAYEYPAEPVSEASKKFDDTYTLRHIYLDLANAQFSAQYSVLDDDEYGDKEAMLRRMTLAERIKTIYFPILVERGAHIVATIPIYHPEARASFYRFTDMTFRTYSVETELATLTEEEDTVKRSDQILFVLGMTGNRPLPPVSTFTPSKRWILRGRFSHGLFAISRNTFLTRLHALLARVNAVTTLVSVSSSSRAKNRRGHVVQLWDKHPERKREPCTWKAIGGKDDASATEFEWKYSQDWRLQEEGTLANMNRALAIHCTTHNRLELPDVSALSDGSLVIKVSGELHLRMQDARNNESWSTESTANWSVTISIKTSTKGNVEVDIDGVDHIRATPAKTTRRGNASIPEVQQILQKHLPKRKDFESVLRELQELQGDWKYYFPAANWFTLCTPMFNLDGDLLFELRRSQTVPHRQSSDTFLVSPTSPNASSNDLREGPQGGNEGEETSDGSESGNAGSTGEAS
ncbi:hypothetical protein BD310DRAFT_989173 [Dichomitus squalens]|uniref:Uncharacterized protein n=1 Tax=Dichomitus squalens TaxID=114155 RepID=A0A4Q9Q4W5_9APHY|nr:hypothetical protein BD310DRAFT_989173 [Dichomitus squalens]